MRESGTDIKLARSNVVQRNELKVSMFRRFLGEKLLLKLIE